MAAALVPESKRELGSWSPGMQPRAGPVRYTRRKAFWHTKQFGAGQGQVGPWTNGQRGIGRSRHFDSSHHTITPRLSATLPLSIMEEASHSSGIGRN